MMRSAPAAVVLSAVLGLVNTACAADAASSETEVGATATTVISSAIDSPGAQTTEPTDEPATTVAAAPPVVAEATTTPTPTLDPGAAGAFDDDLLMLGAGEGFVVLDDPVMVPASEVNWLQPDSIILGVVHSSGEVHAFPADMMAYHHIANTTIAGEPYLVTY